MTDAEILEKLRAYFQNQINNLNATEMAEGPFDDGTEYGDAWEAAAKVIDRRGGLRIRFEFGDTDPTLTAAAQQREQRAAAEARPHDDEIDDDVDQPDGIASNSTDLPDPARAAERVNAFLSWFGDGLVRVDADAPPLFARDLQAVANVAAGRG
ncbi:hypothetical protein [Amycolatopsis kentuckyensis]|uniref:hypothetical protein n=1 Tax=Amycolatopsis kentuckyensis TaxID=218823 RepID=UPI000A3CA276|nr:hypothetical protein [Amycolatopsis kentuckyensis]